MAMNLVRTGAALGVGVASEVLSPSRMAPLNLAGQNIGYDALAEGLAVVGGSLVQFMSPYTVPNVIDGLVTGGIALLGKRAAGFVLKQGRIPVSPSMLQALRVAPDFRSAAARGLVGNVHGVRKVQAT